MESNDGGYAAVKCPSCGAPLPSGAASQVCGYCGFKLERRGAPGEGGGALPGPSSALVEALRFTDGTLPQGWIEIQFAYATAAQCEKFGQAFHGDLVALGNQFINASAVKLQVNYVHVVSLEAAASVYDAIVKMVGKANSVARNGQVVAEIICADAGTVAAVLEHLKPDAVHRAPLKGRWSRR